MFSYCVAELRMSEDMAYKRIRGARAARRFPVIFAAVAEGRLHLTAVVLLAPCLTEATAAELLIAAEHKTKSQVEHLLAARFPRPDLPTVLEALGSTPSPLPLRQLVPGPALPNQLVPEPVEGPTGQLAARPVQASAPAQIEAPVPRPKMTPLSPERFALQVTIDRDTHDKLRYAQALLGHTVPSGDLAVVLKRLVDAGIEQLEQRKFAARARSTPNWQHRTPVGRYIPAEVRRAVWERDGGQCLCAAAHKHCYVQQPIMRSRPENLDDSLNSLCPSFT